MKTEASLLLPTDADALALERGLEIEFVAFVTTVHPLAAAPRCRYAGQRERGNRKPCG